jgi:glycosyltransferase involved in cell wall biosynthesis
VGNGDDGGSRARPADSWLALLDGARPVILYAGTFESYQGIDMLLEAFALLLQGTPPVSGPGDPPDAAAGATEDAALSPASAAGKHGAGPPPAAGKTRPFLLLLGGRPQQVEEARARAGELGIGNDCHFAGTVSRELAQRATRAADVLTSPRTVGDNTPLKIYEQIASRVPLVATRIGSHTQVLSDDECVLVDPDPQSMADGLATALRGGADVARRVANAHALYETSYSPEAYRDKMQRLFARLEGGPR